MQEIDIDLINAAMQTYELEKNLDPDVNALEAAIKSVYVKIQQQSIRETVMAARELAAHLRAEEIPSDEGAAILSIFADDLEEQIPRIESSYEPEDNDIVEVILSGEVTVFYNECPGCGQLQDVRTWSVKDRATGEEYFFDEERTKDLRVRVIAPGIDEMLVS